MFGLDDLFGVGASLLGGFLNNEAAADRQQDANAFSAQQFASRYQTTVKDMTAAGLNPGLAYGGISGNAPTSAMGSPGGMPDLGHSFAQNRMASAQVANINADTANKDAERELMESQAAAARGSAFQAQAHVNVLNESVNKIKAEIPLLDAQRANTEGLTSNLPLQAKVLRATAEKLYQESMTLHQQGMTQPAVRAQLMALVEKLKTDTSLNLLDIGAAEKLDNMGRELGQLKPFFDIIRSIVGHRR